MPFSHTKEEDPDNIIVLVRKESLESWDCTLQARGIEPVDLSHETNTYLKHIFEMSSYLLFH